ncbi:hypothetical protein [Methylobacterium phyllostachyos]|uniref:hypothetical protein n=1 Tax=Methylobacterium phyllostachyos TaxID=582672 RepID=UPI00115FC338|nr:hypothetical protein [Methylobacterium phyllostachyos]
MSKIIIDYSHTSPSSLSAMRRLIRDGGFLALVMLAMSSDGSVIDSSAFMDRIENAPKTKIPDRLADVLVVSDAVLTLSHDVGVGHITADGSPEAIFGLKSFLDEEGFHYVIRLAGTDLMMFDAFT